MLPRLIDEHGPLLARSTGPMILPMAGVYLAVSCCVPPRQYRVTWLVPLFWLGLAFTRIRHGPLFAITALIALADLFPQKLLGGPAGALGSDLYRRPPLEPAPRRAGLDLRPALLPIGLVLTSLVLQTAGLRVPVLGRGWATLDRALLARRPPARSCVRLSEDTPRARQSSTRWSSAGF